MCEGANVQKSSRIQNTEYQYQIENKKTNVYAGAIVVESREERKLMLPRDRQRDGRLVICYDRYDTIKNNATNSRTN